MTPMHRSGVLAVGLVALLSTTAAAQDVISGTAAAIDGNTLIVEGETVRLMGIDAAEADQTCKEWHDSVQADYPCGAHATAFLQSLVAGREVGCVERRREGDGTVVGVCYAAGLDLAEAVAAAGWGVAVRAETTRYVNPSDAARLAQRGLWTGTFDEPAQWRAKSGGG